MKLPYTIISSKLLIFLILTILNIIQFTMSFVSKLHRVGCINLEISLQLFTNTNSKLQDNSRQSSIQ
jgi:hypothetical protein